MNKFRVDVLYETKTERAMRISIGRAQKIAEEFGCTDFTLEDSEKNELLGGDRPFFCEMSFIAESEQVGSVMAKLCRTSNLELIGAMVV